MMKLFVVQFAEEAVVVIADDEKAATKEATFYNREDPKRVIEVTDNSFLVSRPYNFSFEEAGLKGQFEVNDTY